VLLILLVYNHCQNPVCYNFLSFFLSLIRISQMTVLFTYCKQTLLLKAVILFVG
jgi:hypothetical protein